MGLGICVLVLFLASFAQIVRSEPCTNGTHTICTYYVCNMGAQCGFYVPWPWYTTVAAAYEDADFGPTSSKVLIFVTPGNYSDEFVILGFEHSDLTVMALRDSVVEDTFDGSISEKEFPTTLLDPVRITGGFYQVDSRSTVNLTLVGIELSSGESPGSPLFECIQLEGNGSIQFRLNDSTLYCPIRINTGARGSMSIHWSYLFGDYNLITFGPQSYMNAYFATINNSTITLLQTGTASLSQAIMTGNTNIKCRGQRFNIAITYSVVNDQFDISGGTDLHLKLYSTILRNTLGIDTDNHARLQIYSNVFNDYVTIKALQIEAEFLQNTFIAHSRVRLARNQLSAGNLMIFPSCSANVNIQGSIFYNGTLFLILQKTNSPCSADPTIKVSMHYNIFPNPPRIYRFADILSTPAVPAIAFFPTQNYLPLDAPASPYIVDATENYWGSPSGPFHCCVPNGEGAFTTNQIDTSNWCVDPGCTITSNVTLSHTCIKLGCRQVMTKAEIVILWLCCPIGLLLSAITLIVLLIWTRRTSNIGTWASSDVSETCSQMIMLGSSVSVAGNILATGSLVPLLVSTLRTGVSAHQERIPFRCMVIIIVFLLAGGSQSVLNLALCFALKGSLRLAEWLVTPIYLWNVVVVDSVIVLCCWWVPFSGFNELFDPFFLTHSSVLSYLLLLPGALLSLSAAVSVVPIHVFISRTRHSEYSRLNDTIDEDILEIVRHEPKLENSSLRLRQWLAISILTGVLNLLITLFDIANDPYATSRYIIVITQVGVALVSLGLTVYLSFMYYRVHLLMIMTVVTVMWLLGTVTDIWFWASYAAFGDDRLVNNIIHIFSTSIWGLCLLMTVILLYKLRESTLHLLPNAMASNLNQHLDRSWNQTRHTSRSLGSYSSFSKTNSLGKDLESSDREDLEGSELQPPVEDWSQN